jgi:hypothetical protein
MIYEFEGNLKLNACQQHCELATLLEFGTVCRSRFGGPILMNDHVLIAVEGSPARCVEHLGSGGQCISRGRSSQREGVTVFVTRRERSRNQVGCLRAGVSAGGRPQLGERSSKHSKLRHVLRLHGVDGLHLTDHRHFARIHARVAQLRDGDGQNDQNDRDHDQKLD